jgi:hypothetical protein
VIFKPELVDKILAGEKTVTRRRVKYEVDHTWGQAPIRRELPCRYVVGKTYALQTGRGQKAAGRIRILSITRTFLQPNTKTMQAKEARREGFKDWDAFREYWLRLYRRFNATSTVDRIEFELAASSPSCPEALEGKQ